MTPKIKKLSEPKKTATVNGNRNKKSKTTNSNVKKVKNSENKEWLKKSKTLKELENLIEEEYSLTDKKKIEYVDEIFTNGESLVNEIEEKKVVEQTKKSIIKRLIDFLFGF